MKEKAAERMCLLADSMLQGVCESPIIGEKLQQLSRHLKNTKGKRVYGYLKADVKRPPVSGGMGQGQITEHTVPLQPHRPAGRPPLRTD